MDTSFLLIVLILLTFGLVMVFSASYANALYYRENAFEYIIRQGLFALVGVGLMLFVSRVDYRIYKKISLPAYLVGVVMLILVLFIGTARNNVRRWLFGIQPSEIMKLAIILIFAYLIAKNYEKMNTFRYGVMPFLILLSVVVVLLIMEPHLSGTIIVCGIAAVMMFVGGTKTRYFMMLIPIAVVGIVAVILIKDISYMVARVENWLNPFEQENIRGAVWQTCQSLIAIGSGGVMGVGLGESKQKYLYLPEPQNDFIFAIVCEELGMIGAILVIILFILLVYRGFSIANKAPDKFGAMLAIGITVQIGLQALLNIAVVTNSIPNTGISLPFFSYGGTALIMQLVEMGIVLNISRHAVLEKG